jgi:small subunit ribosomal protein S1
MVFLMKSGHSEAIRLMSNPAVPKNPGSEPTTDTLENSSTPSPEMASTQVNAEPGESFRDILGQYEKSHAKPAGAPEGREATVISVTSDAVICDVGLKTEGALPLSALRPGETLQAGDKLMVTIKGRDPEGYYELVRGKVSRPTDWAALEKAFADKATIVGTVTGVVKGGVSVDVGLRAFMPASRSGTRDAAELEKLVEQEIRCRIIKLDAADEDVVVDRRVVLEQEEQAAKGQLYSALVEGQTVSGVVRTIADYGAFMDIGGVDGLLHVSDISWQRVSKPSDVLSVGQQIEAKVLKIDAEKQRISLGMKQLLRQPWDFAAEKYKTGERVRGTVTRLMDFGAFVELEPGIEGLIHISEMSWAKRVRKASDIVKPGDTVEAVILGVNPGERRISLGLKQALGNPWVDAEKRFAPGTVVEGPVTSMTKFGAFVQLAEGIEAMIHVSEITEEKRINHPQDVFRVGQVVKAQVLALDLEKRQVRLGMKQLVPTGLDEYIAEHKEGDVVSGRLVEVSGGHARVELGEGIHANCNLKAGGAAKAEDQTAATNAAKADLSSLGAMLQARWKSGGGGTASAAAEEPRAGQIRKFRVVKLDPEKKAIDVALA